MAVGRCLLAFLAFQAALCYTPRQGIGLGGSDVGAFASFVPPNSGLFVHPFGPQKQCNESYQESTFITFPDARGVVSSLGPLRDFVPLLPNGSLDDPMKFFVDFYEVEGHVVKKEVAPDFPFIQVLFHARTVSGESSLLPGSRLCVEMVAVKDDEITTSFCQVDEESGVCLSNITVPERWWSSLLSPSSTSSSSSSTSSSSSSSTSSSSSPLPREDVVELSYVAYIQSSKCPRGSLDLNPSSLLYSAVARGGMGATGPRRYRLEGGFARLPKVRLVGTSSSTEASYEASAKNSEVVVLVPSEPVGPGRRFRVLVRLKQSSRLKKFSVRAKTKSGLRILGIETHPPWQTELEVGARRQVAEVKAINTESEQAAHQTSAVFDWLLEVDLHPSKVTFTMDYTNRLDHSEEGDESDRRLSVKLKVASDAVERLIPVLESQELINISPITGRPTSYGIAIFAVSSDQVEDVTERSSCFSSDESVLQVSEICGAYYTRGTETRGSTRVHIRVSHGGHEVQVPLKVWTVETPLQVELGDSKLSLMAGWKVPLYDPGSFSKKDSSRASGTSPRTPLSCQARFQSTTVDVYARLVAHDPAPSSSTTTAASSGASGASSSNAVLDLRSNRSESINQKAERVSRPLQGGGQEKVVEGQVTYLLHRKATFKVTHLLKELIRSSDPGVVRVDLSRRDGVIVADGIKPGKTEIQVVSHAGNVIGGRDVRVSMDKVTLDHVKGHATSDLRLQVAPSNDFPGAKVARLRKITAMTRRYQESPLEIFVGFDDDTSLPLKLIHPDDYVLSVESLDNGVVEVAPSDLEFPKVVARGSGSGDLVSLALGPSRFCPTPRPRPLATGHAHVDVGIPHDDLLTQNDAGHFFGFPSKDIIELDVDVVMKNGKFEKTRQKSMKFSKVEVENLRSTPRMKSGSRDEGSSHRDVHLEPLPSQFGLSSSSSSVVQVTMYVLLGIFGLAVAIFVVNCFFYVANGSGARGAGAAGRKSKVANIFVGKSATIKEVQDWIWIDKKTLERNAVNTKCTRALMSPDEFSRASKASGSSSNGECRLSSATDFSSEVSCLSSSAVAGPGKGVGLYRGSECSVRIGGPAMPPDDNGNTLPHDHHSLKCGGGGVGGGGGGSCKQLHQGKYSKEHASPSEQIQADSDVEMTESVRCAPGPDVQSEGQNPSEAEAPGSTLWKDDKMGMSYEQLMKYFSNLKESDA